MKKFTVKNATLACLATSVLSGCLGSEQATVKPASQEKVKNSPVVEAYIEYPGPDQRWVGPRDFMIHVDALHESKKHGNSEIVITKGDHIVRTGPAIDKTREMLKDLEGTIESSATLAPIGCLSPVRIRLVRGDGTVTQKQSCRGQPGWPFLVSQMTDLLFQGVAEQDAGVKPEEARALEKVVEGGAVQSAHPTSEPDKGRIHEGVGEHVETYSSPVSSFGHAEAVPVKNAAHTESESSHSSFTVKESSHSSE